MQEAFLGVSVCVPRCPEALIQMKGVGSPTTHDPMFRTPRAKSPRLYRLCLVFLVRGFMFAGAR